VAPPLDVLLRSLAELVAIPSVSADPRRAADVRAATEWLATRIEAAGGEVELVETSRAPLVIGEVRASSNAGSAPTVLCYTHLDVQPPDPLELWDSDPFTLTEREGRLYGRGVADSKSHVLALVEAAHMLAADGGLPVNVRFALDAEEEVGGDSIVRWAADDTRGADVAVILDGAMLRAGQPALWLSVRGMLYFHVRVRTGDVDMHSGAFGGAALNAVHALTQALGGVVARPDGRLPDALRAGAEAPGPDEREGWSERPDGATALGGYGAEPMDGAALEDFHLRTTREPALDVNGIAGGSPDLVKTVLPVEARANVSIRLAPGQRPDDIRPAFERLLRDAAPPGARIDVKLLNRADPASTDAHAPALLLARESLGTSFGTPAILVANGGTLPVYAAFAGRGIPVVATGFAVAAEANAHAPNENVRAELLPRGVDAVAALYASFAGLR
jgi:acetylornithine deacetylase/succinyl-diaminopimelate desuccinylase-like protein